MTVVSVIPSYRYCNCCIIVCMYMQSTSMHQLFQSPCVVVYLIKKKHTLKCWYDKFTAMADFSSITGSRIKVKCTNCQLINFRNSFLVFLNDFYFFQTHLWMVILIYRLDCRLISSTTWISIFLWTVIDFGFLIEAFYLL